MLFMDLAIEIRRATSDRNDKMEKMKKKIYLLAKSGNFSKLSKIKKIDRRDNNYLWNPIWKLPSILEQKTLNNQKKMKIQKLSHYVLRRLNLVEKKEQGNSSIEEIDFMNKAKKEHRV